MALFLITVTHRIGANNTILEKGMTVEIAANMEGDIWPNRSPKVVQAFANKYGIDLAKLGGVGGIRQYLKVDRIS